MRKALIALLSVGFIAGGLAIGIHMVYGLQYSGPSRLEVNLNRPGAMEALARENPAHYAKIEKILDEVQRHPAESVPGWMKTSFDADSVEYSDLLKTTYPAQRQLSFTLDKMHYRAIVLDLRSQRSDAKRERDRAA
jgi:hypothetical protein